MYRLTFPNGKSYIGITCRGREKRVRHHVITARTGSKSAVHCAIRKYGERSFLQETLLVGGTKYLQNMEIAAIKAFGTLVPDGYNVGTGGESGPNVWRSGPAHHFFGKKFSAEYRAKLSAAAKRRGPRKVTDDERKRIAAKLFGHSVSRTTRDRIAASLRGRNLTQEHRERIGAGLRGRKRGRYRKRVTNGFGADMVANKGTKVFDSSKDQDRRTVHPDAAQKSGGSP